MLPTVHAIPLGFSVAFLLEGPAGLVLVDAGMPGTEWLIWTQMRARGFQADDLGLVLLTHAHVDHCGCLPALLQQSGALLAAHPLAQARLRGEPLAPSQARGLHGQVTMALFHLARPWLANPPLKVDLLLEDGAGLADWGRPAKVLHTPGHTADSLTLLLHDGSAFVGDLLIGRGGWPCPQTYFVEDRRALAASVARLRRARPRRIYTAHRTSPLDPW